jgi:hypothetical protein
MKCVRPRGKDGDSSSERSVISVSLALHGNCFDPVNAWNLFYDNGLATTD